MTLKDFAQMINGKNYDLPMFSKEEIAIAQENGFVIVYGMSDDLIEFEGSIYDEYGCYDGGDVWFNEIDYCMTYRLCVI